MGAKKYLEIITCVIFFVYFSNVVAGAAGLGVFLSDVAEMLTLLAACTCFVIVMLIHEPAAAGTRAETASRPSPALTRRARRPSGA